MTEADEVPERIERVLGEVVDEVPDSDRIYAWFSVSDHSTINGLHDDIPYAPTRAVAEIEVEVVDEGYRVTRARPIDTSDPENFRGEWYEL